MTKTRAKNKTRYRKLCIYCGTEFVAMRSDAKFCSASHKSAYGQNIRRDLTSAKVAETQNKIESLIREIQKSDQAEMNEFGDWLRDWVFKFSDKIKAAIKNNDLKAIEEIHTKLSKAVDELTLLENE